MQKSEVHESQEVELESRRKLSGPIKTFTTVVATFFSLFEVAFLGIWLIDLWIFTAITMMFIFILGILLISEGEWDRNKITLWDILLMICGIAPNIYIIIEIDRLSIFYGAVWTTVDVLFGGMLMFALLALIRRCFGWTFIIIILLFLAYAFLGHLLPPQLFGHPYFAPDRVISFLFGLEGIYGMVSSVFVRIIFLFMLFSAFFQVAGATDFLVKFANAFAGMWRGGPAKVAVIASAMFGSINGNSVANVVTTGTFTIPLMKKTGYKSHFAGAIEAVASTGGQLLPPVMGAGAFIMAEFLGIPYRQIIFAAMIPAALFFIGVFLQIDLEAVKLGLKGMSKEKMPYLPQVLKEGWNLIIPILVLLYLLLFKGSSLTRAALLTIASVIIVTWFRKETRMGPAQIIRALATGAKSSMTVGAICMGVGMAIGAINMTGLGVQFSSTTLNLAGDNMLMILIITAAACLIMGMGLPTTAAYIIVAAVGAPALINLGVMPLAAHLFVFYFACISSITPPMGGAFYSGAALAGAAPLKTGWTATRLGFVAFVVPFLFIYHPELLLVGSPLAVIHVFLTAIFGLILFAMGVEGTAYFGRIKWHPWNRVLFLIAACGLIMPGWVSDVGGVIIFIASLVINTQLTRSVFSIWRRSGGKK